MVTQEERQLAFEEFNRSVYEALKIMNSRGGLRAMEHAEVLSQFIECLRLAIFGSDEPGGKP